MELIFRSKRNKSKFDISQMKCTVSNIAMHRMIVVIKNLFADSVIFEIHCNRITLNTRFVNSWSSIFHEE